MNEENPNTVPSHEPAIPELQPEGRSETSEGSPGTGRLLGLAALGALVAIGEGSGKLFQALVEKGRQSEPEARERLKAVGRTVGHAVGTVENAVRHLGDRVRSLAERTEDALDERVLAALRRAALPTREEIQTLIARVDALNEKLEALRERLQERRHNQTG